MFICSKCEGESPVWHRFCPVCAAEKSLEKKSPPSGGDKTKMSAGQELVHLPSGFPVFDRIFQGGFLQSFVYLIHAEKGAGKTSFLLQVCSYLVFLGKSVVFFSFDESAEGIRKKCLQYELIGCQPHFVCENEPGIIRRTILEHKPDFVVIDSLQSLVQYETDEIIHILYQIRKEAQKGRFVLAVIGEARKDNKDFLGPSSIGHIVDVLVTLAAGRDGEVVISTPNKNRDTDDKTSRCFFRRTPAGLVEISESETGYLPRHHEKAVIGLAAFVARNGNDYLVDEMTAVMDRSSDRAALTIAGITHAKTKSLQMVLESNFAPLKAEFALKANRMEKNLGDAELACIVAVLSLMFEKPVPVDTVFIGGVDNRGCLLPVEGMERRVKRAKALGYKRIIGPETNGSLTAIWEEAETLKGVWKALGFAG
jgi:DNA repair protein RadA/Sms